TVQLMDLKFLDGVGSGSITNAIAALNYAVAHGATISNNSWGDGDYSQALYDAINAARGQGHIFVTAAGNGGDDRVGDNLDLGPLYPASYNLGNVRTLPATTHAAATPSSSNSGPATVDLGAPGLNIISTVRNDGYAIMSGTSMAAPFVTGALALVRSQHPTWRYYQVIDQVLRTVD